MWRVPAPLYSATEAYLTCISSMRETDLRGRLEAAHEDIVTADSKYHSAGTHAEYANLKPSDFSVSNVSATEMSALYDTKMVAKTSPGRAIYDSIKLSSTNGRCPLCGHREVMTLDHYMPKSAYPALAVNPINLVPACSDCNKKKASNTSVTVHPYFDQVEDKRWLFARVQEVSPAAVQFYVSAPSEWPGDLADRVKLHFQFFELNRLYAAQSAREMSGIRRVLRQVFSNGGSAGVRSHLADLADSWRAYELNGWKTAFYEALTASSWYCSHGFELD